MFPDAIAVSRDCNRVNRLDARTPVPGSRPGTYSFSVPRPDPHIVRGVGRQARDRRGGRRNALRTVHETARSRRPVLNVVVLDRRAAHVVRGRPTHLKRNGVNRAHGRACRGIGRFVHVRQADRHRGRARVAGGGRGHRDRVARLRLEVVGNARPRADLARARDDLERTRVRAAQAVVDGMPVRVLRTDWIADGDVRHRVLRHAQAVGGVIEHGRFVHVRNADRHRYRVRAADPVGRCHRDRVARLRFVVVDVAGGGRQLARGGIKPERTRVRAAQGIGDVGAGVGIRRRDRCADGEVPPRVLRHAQAVGGVCEYGRLVHVIKVDRHRDRILPA